MNCSCGFKFSEPNEFRNCECHLTAEGQWIYVCPTCKKEYFMCEGTLSGKSLQDVLGDIETYRKT